MSLIEKSFDLCPRCHSVVACAYAELLGEMLYDRRHAFRSIKFIDDIVTKCLKEPIHRKLIFPIPGPATAAPDDPESSDELASSSKPHAPHILSVIASKGVIRSAGPPSRSRPLLETDGSLYPALFTLSRERMHLIALALAHWPGEIDAPFARLVIGGRCCASGS